MFWKTQLATRGERVWGLRSRGALFWAGRWSVRMDLWRERREWPACLWFYKALAMCHCFTLRMCSVNLHNNPMGKSTNIFLSSMEKLKPKEVKSRAQSHTGVAGGKTESLNSGILTPEPIHLTRMLHFNWTVSIFRWRWKVSVLLPETNHPAGTMEETDSNFPQNSHKYWWALWRLGNPIDFVYTGNILGIYLFPSKVLFWGYWLLIALVMLRYVGIHSVPWLRI